ncbi:outer membrane protein assembly factor BamB family protein [Rugosimonospora africana]|uniref:Pyrrolo-quinoline quinone repeat domain-containing protein n=1 Tax=Rugosimonospora africana TaxID=556532 RepID=A0A8J3QQU3_9ACTN|nr:PQQ-binding-like beta-propeller repeat protein [Rugosimonospora africana]GIH13793.1 hypothetical protein Raf01_19650 [Rugosimonospora africana]
MATTVLIDLGDDWSVGEETVRRRYRGRGSRFTVAGVLGVLVLLLSVSAAVPGPVFVRLATIPVHGQVTIEPGPDAAFVGQQTLGSQEVSRYSISTGRRLWRTTVSDPPENLRYVAAAGVLAVSTFEPVPSGSRLTVLDGATGRPLWSTPGYPLWSWPPDLPAERDQLAVILVGDPAGDRDLRMVRIRTGQAVWSRPLAAGSEVQLADWARSGRPDVLVIGPDGMATVLARGSGALLGTKQLASLAPDGPADPTGQTSMNVVGGSLIVQRRDGSSTLLTDYALPGLAERWHRSGEYFGFPDDCGQVLCIAELNRLSGVDPGTGRVRWTAPEWQGASLIGANQLLGYRVGDIQRSGVLDAGTGRLLRDLGDWSPLAAFGTSRLMTEPDSSDYRYTWFARLDPDKAAIYPVARLAEVGLQGCQPDNDLLFCTTLESDLAVWRYPA